MNDAHASLPYLGQALVFLAAAAILPPLCRWLKVSPIVGFLLFGLIVGPGVLGRLTAPESWLGAVVFTEAEQVRLFAEIGVALLLFTIGLELSFKRLRTLRRLVFGLGGLQLLICTAVIGVAAVVAAGFEPEAALVLGAAFALSSTAMIMQLLAETRRTTTPLGRQAFAILLMQDLAVAPLMLLVSQLAPGADEARSAWLAIGEVLITGGLIVAIIIIAGRYVARPLLRLVGTAHAPEAFMACALFLAVGASAATAAAELSPALGAFLAGMLLAETEFRHQIEVDLEPFKGLLLGLFFASIGMGIDPVSVWPQLGWIVLALAALMIVKAIVIAWLARLFGLDWPRALEAGVLLSQAGEFALVVLSLAAANGVLAPDAAQFTLIVASLSIIVTPFLASAAGMLAARLEASIASDADDGVETEVAEHVIIVGFGRVGQQVAAMLEAEGVPYLAVDRDPRHVGALRQAGVPAVFGDGVRPDLLRRAGADRACALLVTPDDPMATDAIVRAVRREWSELPLHVRARDRAAARALLACGATHATPETLESSLQLGASLLQAFGAQPDVVRRRVDQARNQFMSDAEAR